LRSSPHIHIPYDRLSLHLEFIRRHRLNLEIFFSAETLDTLSKNDLESLLRDLDYGPSLSIHGPFMDLSPGAVDNKIREVTRRRFDQVFDVAVSLKPKSIVFHSGYEKWKYALKVDVWLSKSLEFWQPLAARAEDLGTTIAIENIFEDQPDNLAALASGMASPFFGLCFDTGHCNLFTAVPLRVWLDKLSHYLVELHLHDNDSSADQHLPIGEGTFDFNNLFDTLHDKNLIYTVESHSPEKVLRSIKNLENLMLTIPSTGS
jgi:sugar phosphate isomerase/epimerase